MNPRRDFIKQAALLAGAAGTFGALPASIQKAFAINPEPGTTFGDAEHIVILMQENRSFDHAYGTLQGVRGFDDPRAITLPNQNPVWLQTNASGETYAPFRLDIKGSNATWMGSLPHSWTDQVDARNHGKYDHWLQAKHSGHRDFAHLPLTLGHYTRDDIPFYYALADAFTICDQHFCSSLTGTMPNRLYLWSGTIRGERGKKGPAKVQNSDVEYEDSANWKTFPERLEELNISWKVYQNELSKDVGFTGEEEAWLANFGDNPLEWFTQYHARFLPAHRAELDRLIAKLPGEIETLKQKLQALPANEEETKKIKKQLAGLESRLEIARADRVKWSAENFEKLPAFEKHLFEKGFVTNTNDPDYHKLTTLRYQDSGTAREMEVPKGDVLDQFRRDVDSGNLPTVSWLVAPENFSDHPSSAWFGAWYVSETLDILTKNPEVWKKTIFLLTYDENDGYFDHVPPFTAPHPHNAETGLTSEGLDTTDDFVTLAEELKIKDTRHARESSIGLGYRVPLVIASPWSRGGCVCSQVFDHTSPLQFVETFLKRKHNVNLRETNISDWRRTVCGDLSSSFQPYNGEKIKLPEFLQRDPFVQSIHQAQFKQLPVIPNPLSAAEIEGIKTSAVKSKLLSRQESGTRPSLGLPYQLYSTGRLDKAANAFEIKFEAANQFFGEHAAGAPFNVYAPLHYRSAHISASQEPGWEKSRNWAFAAAAGTSVQYTWPLANFEGGIYFLRVYGPNGFFCEFKGNQNDPSLGVLCDYQIKKQIPTGKLELKLENSGPSALEIEIAHNAYQTGKVSHSIKAGANRTVVLDTEHQWYDFTVSVGGNESFSWRFAGRIETGKLGITDPLIGRV